MLGLNRFKYTGPFLYVGVKPWPVPLREEDRLVVFENTVVLVLKMAQVTGDWRRLHNEKLNNFYS
jgi:hypothetical protein